MIKWISVDDRLPEIRSLKWCAMSKPCLVFVVDADRVSIGRYYKKNGWQMEGFKGNWTVSHWAEITKPNEGDG